MQNSPKGFDERSRSSADSIVKYTNCAAAVRYLQSYYVGNVQTFSPLEQGWRSNVAFSRAIKNNPNLRHYNDSCCNVAWSDANDHECPRWLPQLIEGIRTMRVDYFQTFIRENESPEILLNFPDAAGETVSDMVVTISLIRRRLRKFRVCSYCKGLLGMQLSPSWRY